jgi:hypothetical protein
MALARFWCCDFSGGHHDVGRDVGDPNRRVGGVDVLAAGARGAVGVDADVEGLMSISMLSSITG